MADPLAELRPLHVPPEITWWPPAPGWWLLALLLVLLIAWAWIVLRRGKPRREALRILRAIAQQDLDAPALAQQVNVLLRRYAMACYPHCKAGALTGQAWLEFLNRHGAGRDFLSAAGSALTGAAFAAHAQLDTDELFALARYWIRHNYPGKSARRSADNRKDKDKDKGQGQGQEQAALGTSR